jgi:lantibiotic modifying enzyme
MNEVMAGFVECYDLIYRHRSAWLSGNGPASWVRKAQTRVVFRRTDKYTPLADLLLLVPLPEKVNCRNAISQLLRTTPQGSAWPEHIIEAELAALDNGDVPYFAARSTSRDVIGGALYLCPSVADVSGADRSEARIKRMGRSDLKQQLWLIDVFLRLTDSVR